MNANRILSKCRKTSAIAVLGPLALVLSTPGLTRSQGLNSDGRDFYLGFLAPSYISQNVDTASARFFGAYALVSSYTDNEVSVTYFDLKGNEVNRQVYPVAAHRSVQIALDTKHMRMKEPGETPEWKSCHITARNPVNVSYFSTGPCSGGSYLAISTSALGRQYVVESYHDNESGVGGALSNENSAGYFMIIAPFGETTVEITPTSTTKMQHVGVNCGAGANGTIVPFIIKLEKGECYMVKSASVFGCDISGSTVIANKPVAVLGGHENAFTDGSDPTPGGARILDARDYMIEQMLPVEYWDSANYISIPFVDSQAPVNAGEGDEYRVFSGILPTTNPPGPTGSNAEMNTGSRIFTGLHPYQIPPSGVTNWTSPVNVYSTNGTKIGVAMYDERAQGGGAPFSAPSQMTIIPQARWRHSGMLYVPTNIFETLQGYYITLICNRSDYDKQRILISKDGGKLTPISAAGLAVKRKYSAIPDHPELVGYSMALTPGAYYYTQDTGAVQPFSIYDYGFRAIDKDHDLGDFDGDDYFFSYAAPTAFAKQGDVETSGKLVVTVDTLCDRWHICVTDTRSKNQGIKSLQMINDPNGDITGVSMTSHNVRFDPKTVGVISNYPYEIDLTGSDTEYCADVFPEFPGDSAHLALYILDIEGHSKILTMSKKASSLAVSASPKWLSDLNDLHFPATLAGTDTCVTVFYYNAGKQGDAGVTVSTLDLQQDSGFAITALAPTLPVMLNPGDSLAVRVCFSLKSTDTAHGTLTLHTSCADVTLNLQGVSGYPLINASDKVFTDATLGVPACDTVTVRNVGVLPFKLTSAILLNPTHFSISPASLNQLPANIAPGGSLTFTVCYDPETIGSDSTTITWVTDQPDQSKYGLKTFSLLFGNGVKRDVVWTQHTMVIFADSNVNPVQGFKKIFLRNDRSTTAHIRKVLFESGESGEFVLADNQPGYNPLEDFGINPHDSIWVLIQFAPNLDKPYPARFADRHTKLVATFDEPSGPIDSDVAALTGTFNLNAGVASASTNEGPLMTAAVLNGRILVTMPTEMQELIRFDLYDLLGRRVYEWPQGYSATTEGYLTLPVPQVANGVYVLRASSGGRVATCKVVRK